MTSPTDAPAGFDPRDSTSAAFARIREAILNGEIAPGEVVSQVTLAEKLGISRTPLREALRMLQSEGLVVAEPNRRVRIGGISDVDLEELCVIRVSLESEAIRLSVPTLTPEDIARLEGYMAEMAHYAEIKDYFHWGTPHRSFHRALTSNAGPRTNVLLDQLFDHAERYRRIHIGRGPTAWATSDHRNILDACKAGDREQAATLLAHHLARTAFEVIEILSPSYHPVRLKQVLADVTGSASDRRRS